jgi:hypothetical protein
MARRAGLEPYLDSPLWSIEWRFWMKLGRDGIGESPRWNQHEKSLFVFQCQLWAAGTMDEQLHVQIQELAR